MKQHITSEQLNELSSKQRETIAKILNVSVAPRLSIGQLIELLYHYDRDDEIVSAGARWDVACAGHINESAPELIDALFEAVKSVL